MKARMKPTKPALPARQCAIASASSRRQARAAMLMREGKADHFFIAGCAFCTTISDMINLEIVLYKAQPAIKIVQIIHNPATQTAANTKIANKTHEREPPT